MFTVDVKQHNKGCLDIFPSSIISILSLRDGPIKTEILSQKDVKPKTTNRSTTSTGATKAHTHAVVLNNTTAANARPKNHEARLHHVLDRTADIFLKYHRTPVSTMVSVYLINCSTEQNGVRRSTGPTK